MWYSAYLAIALITFGYSYGFTDLNLTLSSHPLAVKAIAIVQNLVYFHRSQSRWVYLALILLAFLCYLKLYQRWKDAKTFPWKKVSVLALIFALAYPLLSHDVFKYLFSARMVLQYQLNPHLVSPDAVQGDLWLRFMRWVHTPSPYGPVFTLITLPAYILGLGKFTLSLMAFKLLNLGWYLTATHYIGKVSEVLGQSFRQARRNQLFFALNPLVLWEALANAHNDVSMMALLLIALWLLANNKKVQSLGILLASIAIKYVTALVLPLYVLERKIKKEYWATALALVFLLAPLLYYKQYQPWYILWFTTAVALTGNTALKAFSIAYAFGGFLRYIPFVLTGLWSATPFEFTILTFTPPLAYLVFARVSRKTLL